MPAEIEKVSGVPAMIRKAGKACSGRPQSISPARRSMRKPTITRAGATAGWMNASGPTWTPWPTRPMSGTKRIASANSAVQTSEDRPVRALSATPAPDST